MVVEHARGSAADHGFDVTLVHTGAQDEIRVGASGPRAARVVPLASRRRRATTTWPCPRGGRPPLALRPERGAVRGLRPVLREPLLCLLGSAACSGRDDRRPAGALHSPRRAGSPTRSTRCIRGAARCTCATASTRRSSPAAERVEPALRRPAADRRRGQPRAPTSSASTRRSRRPARWREERHVTLVTPTARGRARLPTACWRPSRRRDGVDLWRVARRPEALARGGHVRPSARGLPHGRNVRRDGRSRATTSIVGAPPQRARRRLGRPARDGAERSTCSPATARCCTTCAANALATARAWPSWRQQGDGHGGGAAHDRPRAAARRRARSAGGCTATSTSASATRSASSRTTTWHATSCGAVHRSRALALGRCASAPSPCGVTAPPRCVRSTLRRRCTELTPLRRGGPVRTERRRDRAEGRPPAAATRVDAR